MLIFVYAMIKEEIKYLVWAIGLGVGLVAYGQHNFASREEVRRVIKHLEIIDSRLFILQKSCKRVSKWQ